MGDGLAPAPAAEAAPPSPALAAVELVRDSSGLPPGYKDFDVAPKGGRAKCWICDAVFEVRNFRIIYRTKRSFKPADERRIHTACAHRCPAEFRASDHAKVMRVLVSSDLVDDARAMLEDVTRQWAS